MLATPIINQPQVAILDLEAVVKRPVVIADEAGSDAIAIRPMAYLCMSWDHRALDGAEAARFLGDVKQRLERAGGASSMSADAGIRARSLVVEHGRGAAGCTVAVAVHSTALGPALGGARMWHYADRRRRGRDALRLAEAMTLKAAAAGLDLGGGKGVIAPRAGPAAGELRRAMLLDFGDLVESLGGRYVTAEDVGTGAADMAVIAERTAHVVGLPPSAAARGDPSPVTALGVVAAMRACVRAALRQPESCAGVRVCVIGARPRRRAAGARLLADGGRRADRHRRRSGQARAAPSARAPTGSSPATRSGARATCSPPAPSAGRSTPRRSSGCAAACLRGGEQRARRRGAGRAAGASAGSSTRPTSSPTPAA